MKKIKTRFYFLFLINLSLISFSKNADNSLCDNSRCVKDGYQCKGKAEGSCGSYCKPNVLSQMCYKCGNSNYYEINEKDKACTDKASCPNYIISDSKQCVNSCGNYYKLGQFCYSSCAGNMEIKDESERECKCSNLYYIGTKDGKQFYHCYGADVLCTSDHDSYDLETKECKRQPSDCDSKKKKVIRRAGMIDIKRCSYTCEEDDTRRNYTNVAEAI